MEDWTEHRRTLVQLSFDAYDDSLNRDDKTDAIVQTGIFAKDILCYLCKDIAAYGTVDQKRRILQIMSTFRYVWDENDRRYVHIDGDNSIHPSTPGFIWCDELSILTDYAFDYIEDRSSPMYELAKRLLFDIARGIIFQGSEEQLNRFNAFLDQTAGVL
jgi:hypothetical protein